MSFKLIIGGARVFVLSATNEPDALKEAQAIIDREQTPQQEMIWAQNVDVKAVLQETRTIKTFIYRSWHLKLTDHTESS